MPPAVAWFLSEKQVDTAGAVIYGMKKPNPIPGVFGFHEIFHALTVVAFLCHWSATLLLAINPPFNGG